MLAVRLTAALSSPRRPAWLDACLVGWVAAERGWFAPWLAVLMGAGSLGYFAWPTEPDWRAGPLALCLSAALAALLRRAGAARAVALCAVAASAGFASAQLGAARALPVEPLPTRAVVLTAVVRSVEQLPEGRRLVLADVRPGPDAAPLVRSFRLNLRASEGGPFEAGDAVRVRALLRPPPPPAYPGAWDLQRDAFFAGQGGSAQALGPVSLVAHEPPSGVARWWQGVRDAVGRRVMADVPGPAGAIAATFLTGNQAAIPAADRAAFRDSGLAHLLAVAGLHMGLAMGLVMGAVRLGLACWERAALHWPVKAIAGAAALAAGFGYMLLAGAHVPVVRSFAMAALVTLAVMSGRRAVSMRGLAFAAAAILLAWPNEVNGVGFQMSFSAVAALIAGYAAARPWLARLRGEGGWRRGLLTHVATLAFTSVLAGAASAPFAAYHFGHAQVYSVLANLAAVPITALVIMPAGLATLALMPFGLDAAAAAPMGWGIEAVLAIARATAALPSATVAIPHVPAPGLAAIAIGLAWLCLWRTRVRLAGLAPIALGSAVGWATPAPDILVSPDRRLVELAGHAEAGAGASFIRDAWSAYLGIGALQPLPSGTEGELSCTEQSCRLTRRGGTALLLRQAGERPNCAEFAIVLAAVPVRAACLGAAPPVWRDGAQAVWLTEGGARVLSDRAYRGDRPWVPPPPGPRRPQITAPAAESETLPE